MRRETAVRTPLDDAPAGLASALRERTAALHARAEGSGIVRAMLNGTATRAGYALLLRNLVPAYRQLEDGLRRLSDAPGVRAIALPQVYRSEALAADLDSLCGNSWDTDLPELEVARRYAARVQGAANDGARLIAHAYVRHLGDLSGGLVLRAILARTPGLPASCLAFCEFPAVGDPAALRSSYRAALDRAGREIADARSVVEEAAVAFELNIELSEAVQQQSGPG